jgi:tetraacyldisaccharide 4'-kinase
VHAVAGIGNPARFFAQLRRLGLQVIEHPFPDHHRYAARDIRFPDSLPVIMTQKDAVKCERFAGDHVWYLAVEARPDARVGEQVWQRLKETLRG